MWAAFDGLPLFDHLRFVFFLNFTYIITILLVAPHVWFPIHIHLSLFSFSSSRKIRQSILFLCFFLFCFKNSPRKRIRPWDLNPRHLALQSNALTIRPRSPTIVKKLWKFILEPVLGPFINAVVHCDPQTPLSKEVSNFVPESRYPVLVSVIMSGSGPEHL